MATAGRIDEHLVHCLACREFYETNDDISQLISHCDEINHPGGQYLEQLSTSVLDSLYDESGEWRKVQPPPLATARSWGRPLWWTGGFATALLLILGLAPLATDSKRERSVAGAESNPTLGEIDAVSRIALAASFPLDSVAVSLPAPRSSAGGDLSKSAIRNEAADRRNQPLFPGATPWFGSDDTGAPWSEVASGVLRPPRPGPPQPDSSWLRNPDLPSQFFEATIVFESTGSLEAGEHLKDLVREFGRAVAAAQPASGAQAGSPLARQAELFWAGEAYWREGRPAEAFAKFRRVFQIDPTTRVASRADFGIAEINFYDFGNFAEAYAIYSRLSAAGAALAFDEGERAKIKAQLELLRLFEPEGFAPLECSFAIARGPWERVGAAMDQIAADAQAACLLGGCAQSMVDRIAKGDHPGEARATELVERIERCLSSAQDAKSRAWLHLARGELFWTQMHNADLALAAYEKTISIGQIGQEKSPAVSLASRRQQQIREQALARSSR